MDDILKVNSTQLQSSDYIPDVEVIPARYLNLDFIKIDPARIKGFLAGVAQRFQLLKDFKDGISPIERYVLDIPPLFKKAIDSGEAWFNTKKDTGEMLASISHQVGKKKEFMKNFTVKKESFVNDRAFAGISDGMYNIAMQQQLAAIANQLQDVQKGVQRIEIGQKDDRFAKIEGARYQMLLASKMPNKVDQIDCIKNAMPLLAEGTESVKRAFIRRVNDFEAIPESKLIIYGKMVISTGNYKDKKDREIDDINEHFMFISAAHELMAAAGVILEAPDAVSEVFNHEAEFLGTIDKKKIASIANMHPELDVSNEWFTNPTGFIEEAKKRYIDCLNQKFDFFSIEVTGQQLLEAMEDEKTEQTE